MMRTCPTCSTDHFRWEPCTPVSRRPFCIGCGYYLAVNGAHRPDCTTKGN
jgi:hypothetical protein